MGSYPPPFNPAPPRKNSNTKVILIILGLVAFICIGGLAATMIFGYRMLKDTIGPIAGCGMGFDNVRSALEAYAAKNEGKLPPAATWQDDVRPFLVEVLKKSKNELEGIVPEIDPGGSWGCKDGKGGLTGMAFNSELAGKKVADIKNPETTVLLFEVPTIKANQSLAYAEPPEAKRPMMMGKPRPFIKLHVKGEGDFNMNFKNGDWQPK